MTHLKILAHTVQNRQFIQDAIYIYMNIFIDSFKTINSLKMCYLQYDVSRFCCGYFEYI